ncbi:MAG: DUF368 domain-containing protein [Acutalibacteraceae bacterium]
MKFILNIIYGMIVGVANIIPGVSGGTMAVILNIYDKLLAAFTGLRKQFKKSIMYLIPIGIGAVVGIFAFSKLLEYLLYNFPLPTFFFFIGLIVGGLPLVFRKALETKFKPVSLIPCIIAFGIMIALAFVNTEGMKETTGVFEMNITNWFYLFFGSALSAMCMIIPGVSGSMILMIVGLYSTVLLSISHLTSDFMNSVMILIPVGLGVVVGIVGGAKLIDLCVKKFPQMTFFAIIGLMVGSLLSIYNNAMLTPVGESKTIPCSIFSVYNNAGFNIDLQSVIALIAMLVGLAVSLIFGSEKIKEKFSKKSKNQLAGDK